MSYTEFHGVLLPRAGVSVAALRLALTLALGPEAAALFDNAFSPPHNPHPSITFDAIPPEGAQPATLERALVALAPLVRDGVIACVEELNWTDASLYRIRHGHVQVARARLTASGPWRSLTPSPAATARRTR